jgi:hypothetical protein
MAATTPVTDDALATEHVAGWRNGAAVCPDEAAIAVPAASIDAMIAFRAMDTS